MSDPGLGLDYDNVSHRPGGWLVRLGARLSPGVRKIQAQIGPYAQAWAHANASALAGTGLLWVVLGDSMSQGIGASRYDCGWVSQLHALLEGAGSPYRVLNLSVYGARVGDVLTHQLPAMRRIDTHPALVTVLIGSNDIVSRRHRRDLVDNYRELLRQLPRGAVVASPFGNLGLGRELNDLITTEAAERGLRTLNNHSDTRLSSWRGRLAEDHFHPNDLGYGGLAEAFFETIQT